jgi:mono/diheme cytochrome c family protein
MRCLALATPLISFAFLGCDPEGYPTELKYPLRSDIIIDSNKLRTDDKFFFPDPPGRLDQHFRAYQAKYDQEKGAIGVVYDPSRIDPTDRTDLAAALDKWFGTPSQPTVKIDPEDEKASAFMAAAEALQLDDATLAAGGILYRRHCLHCHGLTGDGRGPTGPWLSPHPRDYRKGKFKYTSTRTGTGWAMPSRDDLFRTLTQGVPGTSMPSFGVLPEEQLEQLVSYVIHLSLRGQAEEITMVDLIKKKPGEKFKDSEGDEISIDQYLQARFRFLLLTDNDGWSAANRNNHVITPSAPFPEEKEAREQAITNGYKTFISDAGGCLKCHTDYGRQALFLFDEWGTLVRPRDLTAGGFRGGRRPIDLFWRIKGGIGPSTMPKIEGTINDKQVWELVAFAQAVAYPNMLPEDVRKIIYPPPPVPEAKKD